MTTRTHQPADPAPHYPPPFMAPRTSTVRLCRLAAEIVQLSPELAEALCRRGIAELPPAEQPERLAWVGAFFSDREGGPLVS